ncbi:hypothetical protein J2S21_004640, partial [Peribacillus cavernae]|nr:hypothetical protein [Peribacillus cavernae]
HGYIHSFRFAQGTKRYETSFLKQYFGESIAIGIPINYKSRGGEWATPDVE